MYHNLGLRSGPNFRWQYKDFEGAIEKWEQLITKYPNTPFLRDALFNIGQSHTDLENYKEALASYYKLLEGFSDDTETQNRIERVQSLVFDDALALFNKKQYKEAYKAFDNFTNDEQLKGYSLSDGAMYNTAICLSRQGKYDAALKRYEAFTKEFPNSEFVAEALFHIGSLNYTLKEDYKQSLSTFRKILNKYSKSNRVDEAIVGIVLNLSKLNEYSEIQDQVDNFKRRLPTNKWLAILESYKKGIKPFGYAMSQLMLWERKLEWENARTAFKEILRNTQLLQEAPLDLKGDVEAHIARLYFVEGEDHYKRKAYKVSRETFDKLRKHFPNSDLKGEARRLSAQSYLDEEKYNQAYLSFDALTSTEFDGFPQLQAEAMYKAAYSLKSLSIDGAGTSDYKILNKALSDEALTRYAEFLTLYPKSEYVSDTFFDQGKIYTAQKKYEFALKRYEDALRNTDNPQRCAEIQLGIGRVYQKLNSDNKAIEVFEEAVKAAEQAIESNITAAKLDRARAMFLIVSIHRQQKDWGKVRDIYNNFIQEYGEAGYNVTTSEFGEEIETDFMAICAYWIGEAYYEMNDLGKALEWHEKIVKEKGFQTDDSVPDALRDKDFRADPLTPQALHRALLVRNRLEGAEKLEQIANTYINGIRNDNPLLSAKARFKFAKIKREALHDYEGAAEEFAKLEAYRGSDLRLNLVKLQGKYYEGHCYKELASIQKTEEAYTRAIMLFSLNFQHLIETPNIKPSNISEKAFDYCIQTALEYAEKACAEITVTEYTQQLCAEIKTARRKLENKDKTTQKSDASHNSNSSEASQNKGQLTPEQIAKKGSSSTVFITMKGLLEYEDGQVIDGGGIDERGEIVDATLGIGSGFFVKPDQIATNYHVIEPEHHTPKKDDSKNEYVFSHPLRGTARRLGTDTEYAIIGYTAIDPDRDLAILKVRALGVRPLSLGDSAEVNQGEAVYPIGNPLGLANVVSEGQISSVQWVKSIREFMNNKSKLVKDFRRDDTRHKLFMMTAPISRGNSGGPVLDSEGRVIGVSVGSRGGGQNLNYVVPVNYLKTLLNRVGPPKPLSDLEIVY